MTDQHLERIEAKLDRVIATQSDHTVTLGQHTATLHDHSQRFEQIDRRVDQIDRRVDAVEGLLGRVDTKIGTIETTLSRQDTRLSAVEVSLETTIPEAIKRIAEGQAMLQQHMDRGFAEIKEHIDQRLGPFEEAVRQHSAKLAGLRQRYRIAARIAWQARKPRKPRWTSASDDGIVVEETATLGRRAVAEFARCPSIPAETAASQWA